MKKPPDEIWLQFYGSGNAEEDAGDDDGIRSDDVTWCGDKIFDSDVRYVIDKRYKPRRVH